MPDSTNQAALASVIGQDIHDLRAAVAALQGGATHPPTLWPITPIDLQPPDAAGELPAWASITAVMADLTAYEPVDLQLVCWGLNTFDLQLNTRMDIATDAGLDTACLISLFTDRYDAATQRGGWWGDDNPDSPQLFGSRLWKLSNRKIVSQTLRDAENYAKESLQWLVDDGLLTNLTVAARWEREDGGGYRLKLAVTAVYQKNSHYREGFSREYLI